MVWRRGLGKRALGKRGLGKRGLGKRESYCVRLVAAIECTQGDPRMRYVVLGCRLVEGLMFFVFGLNNLLHFFAMPAPSGDALTWFGIMASHHWINFVAVLQVVAGLLLMVGRFVPLALTVLAAVIVNILLYHALLWPHGYVPALVVLVMQLILMGVYWRSFAPLLAPNPEARTELQTPKI